MDNFNWKLIFDGISMLTRALPENEKLRRWVVIGAVAVVAAAVIATQLSAQKELPDNS